jgi:beta-N-acetylhexosaminidase
MKAAYLKSPSMRIALLSLILAALATSCARGRVTVIPEDAYLAREARAVAATLTTEEKAAQVLMTGIDGKDSFAPRLYGHFRGTVPGAILLFRYNIADSASGVDGYLRDCDRAFFALGSSVPPIFAIDHEGGTVFRTAGVTSALPAAETVARKLTPEKAQALYRASGEELALLGIGLNLAPVAETLTDGNADFLGTRAYSSSPETVARYARSAINGFREGGVACAVKHFPGNGVGDPHRGLPRLDASRKILDSQYIAPFRKTLKAKPDAVLVSHVVVTAIDPERPFCLSKKGVTGLLRKKLGFSGLVITDDVAMAALAGNGYAPEAAALLALSAGCDMIMTSAPDSKSISSAIAREAERDPAFMRRLDEAVSRVLAVKAKTGAVWTARERLALSRMGCADVNTAGLDAVRGERFRAARRDAESILGDINEK